MATQIDIANSALIKIGSMPINALNDGSKKGQLLGVRFANAVEYVLREHPWKCAIKRVALSPTGVPPLAQHTLRQWGFAYNLPADYIRLVLNDDDQLHFQIEGRQFLSNDPNAIIRYVWNVDDITILDSHLAETVACYLGADIAMAIIQNTAVVDRMQKTYMQTLSKAKFIDASTNRAITQNADYYVDARLQANHI